MRGPDGRLAGVGITLAGIVLAVAGCTSHPVATATPAATAPQPPAAVPQLHHLGSPIVLAAMLSQRRAPAGGCPAGSVALSAPGADPGQCYRQLGKPVTITSAAVSLQQLANAAGQQAGPSGAYALLIILPPADVAALTAITTKASDSRGYVDISVAGKTWSLPEALAPLTGGRFQIVLPSRNQALQLQRILVPPA